MNILIALGLVLINFVWLALVVMGLPGTWLMAATTALVAWWRWDGDSPMIGTFALVVIIALAVVGEVVEFAAGAAGAKKAGATRRGSIGALVGAIFGGIVGQVMIPLPVVGALIGACVGAGVGAWGMELSSGRRFEEAYRVGIGAGVGRFHGTVAKLAVAAAMWVVIAVAAFWP